MTAQTKVKGHATVQPPTEDEKISQEVTKKAFLERLSYLHETCLSVIYKDGNNHSPLRRIAIWLSVLANIGILAAKCVSYSLTRSLAVLAALIDSVLDLVSQLVLFYTSRKSNIVERSSEYYPAGASRLEPVGVLICAALMGMASFEVLKDSIIELLQKQNDLAGIGLAPLWFMLAIIVTKFFLFLLCKKASYSYYNESATVKILDPTLDALAQDHLNDVLSNSVAAAALLAAISSAKFWYLDPIGAIFISLYIIYSWYNTGKVQINQLTGISAPDDFIEELKTLAANFDQRIEYVDVCRAYHFGPKFLVEIEIVLPRNTPLCQSHDLGMDLQYEIEGREEVERCFVHIDYENRPYDEHVISKNVELRERVRRASNGLIEGSNDQAV